MYNAGPMSKTLGRRCTKVKRMFHVPWDTTVQSLNVIAAHASKTVTKQIKFIILILLQDM